MSHLPFKHPASLFRLCTALFFAALAQKSFGLAPGITKLTPKYRQVPASNFNLTDEEGYPVDLVKSFSTCEDMKMAKIQTRDECRRAAQQLGYCGNMEQYFVHRNSTGHILLHEGKNIKCTYSDPKCKTDGTKFAINPVRTNPSTWKWKKQCETCPEFLNPKITGPVLLGEMFDSENCNRSTIVGKIKTMEVPECQSTFHDDRDEAFSWKYSCNDAGTKVKIIPYPKGTTDCTGRSTTFGTGVWADLHKYDTTYETDQYSDNFFTSVQPVIGLAQINNPQCASTEDPYPCHWFPAYNTMEWGGCLSRQSAKVQIFRLPDTDRKYRSLKWSCVQDPDTGANPNRVCGNATGPPPAPKSRTSDTHEYPHEDKWPAGCFILEEGGTGVHSELKTATLVFNDNFASEAKCTDSGENTGSTRCLCGPDNNGNSGLGYNPNDAALKAKGYVLKCMPNGWCGYVDENSGWKLCRASILSWFSVIIMTWWLAVYQ
jgi:hypothetical protein